MTSFRRPHLPIPSLGPALLASGSTLETIGGEYLIDHVWWTSHQISCCDLKVLGNHGIVFWQSYGFYLHLERGHHDKDPSKDEGTDDTFGHQQGFYLRIFVFPSSSNFWQSLKGSLQTAASFQERIGEEQHSSLMKDEWRLCGQARAAGSAVHTAFMRKDSKSYTVNVSIRNLHCKLIRSRETWWKVNLLPSQATISHILTMAIVFLLHLLG